MLWRGLLLFLALLAFETWIHFAGAGSLSPSITVHYVTSATLSYAGSPVGTSTPVQLIAKLPDDCTSLDIDDSSGQTLELMAGAVGAETRVRLIPPGGLMNVQQHLFYGTRVSIRAVSGTASTGTLVLTCLTN